MDQVSNLPFLLLTATVAVAAASFLLRRRRRRKQLLPPSPPGRLPLIGHLHLLTDMPHHTFAGLAQNMGPIMYLQLGRVPTVVISSAELAREVLKSQDHVFCNRPQLISAQYLSFGCSDVTFSQYGPYWRQARKICVTELLSSKRVNSFEIIRVEETNRLLEGLWNRSGSRVDLSELVFNLANDVLCRVAFGRRFEDKGGKGLVDVLTETQSLFAGFCIGDFYPDWGWVNSVSGYKRRLENNLRDLRAVSDKIIEEHLQKKKKKKKSESSSEEDFVDVLLRVQQSQDLEVPISDDNLKALVLDMFVAGTDTSSSTLEWTMTELVRHPEAMRKAQDEVRGVASGKQSVDESHLPQLGYMKATIKEAMRIHPPVPLLVPRESMDRCVLNGFEIPAKTRVLINTYAIGRDPESWDDPLRYDPQRFLAGEDEDEDRVDFKGQDFRFLPFGGGRRGCPGYSFGLATVEIALARLLFHFDWELPPGLHAQEMDLSEIFGLATRKKSPLVLVPTANKDYPLKGEC